MLPFHHMWSVMTDLGLYFSLQSVIIQLSINASKLFLCFLYKTTKFYEKHRSFYLIFLSISKFYVVWNNSEKSYRALLNTLLVSYCCCDSSIYFKEIKGRRKVGILFLFFSNLNNIMESLQLRNIYYGVPNVTIT